jgi:hypothetical protein
MVRPLALRVWSVEMIEGSNNSMEVYKKTYISRTQALKAASMG